MIDDDDFLFEAERDLFSGAGAEYRQLVARELAAQVQQSGDKDLVKRLDDMLDLYQRRLSAARTRREAARRDGLAVTQVLLDGDVEVAQHSLRCGYHLRARFYLASVAGEDVENLPLPETAARIAAAELLNDDDAFAAMTEEQRDWLACLRGWSDEPFWYGYRGPEPDEDEREAASDLLREALSALHELAHRLEAVERTMRAQPTVEAPAVQALRDELAAVGAGLNVHSDRCVGTVEPVFERIVFRSPIEECTLAEGRSAYQTARRLLGVARILWSLINRSVTAGQPWTAANIDAAVQRMPAWS